MSSETDLEEFTKEELYAALLAMVNATNKVSELLTVACNEIARSGAPKLAFAIETTYLLGLTRGLGDYVIPEALHARLAVDTEPLLQATTEEPGSGDES